MSDGKLPHAPRKAAMVMTGSVGGNAGGASGPAAALLAGTTSITILSGANVQGNPSYSQDNDKVPLTNKIAWVNKDTTPGTGASDPNSGKAFDTKIITNGQSSSAQHLKGVKVGDVVPYYCQIHPYMTGKITVIAATSSSAGGAAGASPALTILEGASPTVFHDTYDSDILL